LSDVPVTISTDTAKPKLNKFEKYKAEKDGLLVKDELEHFSKIGWEAVDETDLTQRLKVAGYFLSPGHPRQVYAADAHAQRHPQRLKGPYPGRNHSALWRRRQRRYYHSPKYATAGHFLEDIPDIFQRFGSWQGLTSVQSGMDNVRNITGSPVAGIDANELIDTQGLVRWCRT
jgi:ferredoxin-nitrite reductase